MNLPVKENGLLEGFRIIVGCIPLGIAAQKGNSGD